VPHFEPAWTSGELDTLDLQLDPENPRIEVPHGATQDKIRSLLLEQAELADLATQIVANGGLLHGERVIAFNDGGSYVILEGNRRVSACQMLLDNRLVPTGFENKFPRLSPHDGAVRARLEKIRADIAPSREAAETTIARRHTVPGILPWTPIAKQRYIMRLVASGKSPDQIAALVADNKSVVLKTIREYHLIQLIYGLSCWTTTERAKLNSPALKPTAFTRFFSLAGVKPVLKLRFSEEGKPQSGLESGDFAKVMEALARELLLPTSSGKTAANTRAAPDDVFRKILVGPLQKLRPAPKKRQDKVRSGRPAAKIAPFFEKLQCPVQDNQLIKVVDEIAEIDYRRFPTAATFLVRALLERILDYCIRKRKLQGRLRSEYVSAGSAAGKDPGLDFVIRFCIKHHDDIFSENVRRTLGLWLSNSKHVCDLVIHGKYLYASPSALDEIAGHFRPFVERVFEGAALL
jgi:hypothetical protein